MTCESCGTHDPSNACSSDGHPDLGEHVALPNQKHVWIRPLRPGEVHTVVALLARLEPATWYKRFFCCAPRTCETLARSLAAVDDHSRLALVAEHRTAGATTQVIALANVAAVSSEQAEVGLVVRDDWQRQQVGTELAIRAMQASERRGFSTFVADVEPHNIGIRRLLARIAVIVSRRFNSGVSEYLFVRRC